VNASAAQKQPVIKTCLQCGAILPSGISACRFCDSIYQAKLAIPERASILAQLNADTPRDEELRRTETILLGPEEESISPPEAEPDQNSTWRGELANRVLAYRVRHRKVSPDAAQSQLPFIEPVSVSQPETIVAVAEQLQQEEQRQEQEPEAFSFTIAIGRIAGEQRPVDGRMVIDVSLPADSDPALDAGAQTKTTHEGLYPVASMWDRRVAGLIDAACLIFACGGFLALFGSLGGQLTLSKLSAAVCVTALAVVYLQYFALFTIFGGTTPGMMFRGLQVVSFSGDIPTPRQMLLRSAGYMISATPCFMGFLWALWDEDELTWHDRFSKTYLSSAQTYAEIERPSAAHLH
jgi:uncharacterized RDD family membrane protein YckC